MDIGEVLSKAWQIIWKHKVLWIFGIMAGCTAGSNTGSGGLNYTFSGQDYPRGLEQFFFNLQDWQIALLILAMITLVLVFIIIVVLLGTFGRIGIVRGTMQADAGESRLSFGELLRGSSPYFWRVFGLNLLIGLAIFAVVGVLIAFFVLLSVVTFGIGAICLLPLLCLVIPIAWFVGVVIEQVNVALIVENTGVFEGIRRGWEVVRGNLGEVILMGLILGIGGGIVSFLIGIPFAFLTLPLIFAIAFGSGSPAWGIGITLVCLVIYLPVLLVLSGALRSYIGSAWALTYMRLTGRTPIPASQMIEPVA
jgi:hypothetical protein